MRKKHCILLSVLSMFMLSMVLPIAVDSLASSASAGEFRTPSFGGGGGNKRYNLDCGKRSVMVGTIFKAGSWLDALGIICQRVNPKTGVLGHEFTRGPVGGSGGKSRIRRCNEGDVVHGLVPFSGQFVNGMILHCKPWIASQKRPESSPTTRCNKRTCKFVGVRGPENDSFACPRGKVGKAFRGKYGWYIDSTRFVCDNWDK